MKLTSSNAQYKLVLELVIKHRVHATSGKTVHVAVDDLRPVLVSLTKADKGLPARTGSCCNAARVLKKRHADLRAQARDRARILEIVGDAVEAARQWEEVEEIIEKERRAAQLESEDEGQAA